VNYREPNLVDEKESRSMEVRCVKHAEEVDVLANRLDLDAISYSYASSKLSRVCREGLDLALLIEVI
jgi:hypothetical protein